MLARDKVENKKPKGRLVFQRDHLEQMSLARELRPIAKDFGIQPGPGATKEEIVAAIIKAQERG